MDTGLIAAIAIAVVGGFAVGAVIQVAVLRPMVRRAKEKRADSDLVRLAGDLTDQGRVPGFQQALEQVRRVGPEPVTRAAEQLAALAADPEANDQAIEQARARFIAAAQDALTP